MEVTAPYTQNPIRIHYPDRKFQHSDSSSSHTIVVARKYACTLLTKREHFKSILLVFLIAGFFRRLPDDFSFLSQEDVGLSV